MYFDRSCQGVVIHGPGRAALERISLPELKPGDVVIRTASNGICGTDLQIFDGTLGYFKNNPANYPYRSRDMS